MKKWINAIKRNYELEEKLSELNHRIIDLGGSNIDKDKRIKELRSDVNKEFSQRTEIETKYNKLKKEAIDFYKNDLLMISMKIIFKLLKEEKPTNALLQQQALAQQALARVQQESLFNRQSFTGGMFG